MKKFNKINSFTQCGCSIPVNRPYLGGTVPLLLYHPTSVPLNFLKSTSFNHKVAKKDDSEKRLLLFFK